MSQTPNHSTKKKLMIVLEGLKNRQTLPEVCQKYQITPEIYRTYLKQLLTSGNPDNPVRKKLKQLIKKQHQDTETNDMASPEDTANERPRQNKPIYLSSNFVILTETVPPEISDKKPESIDGDLCIPTAGPQNTKSISNSIMVRIIFGVLLSIFLFVIVTQSPSQCTAEMERQSQEDLWRESRIAEEQRIAEERQIKEARRIAVAAGVIFNNDYTEIIKVNDEFKENCTQLVIPPEVKVIGEHAFSDCYKLTSVSIPASVKEFGNGIFESCSNLKEVTLQSGVSSIAPRMFGSCEKLQKVNIPGSVKTIGNDAFICCMGLTNITLPDGMLSIGTGAFLGCQNLQTVSIPESMTMINNDAFMYCKSLLSVNIPKQCMLGKNAFPAECKVIRR